MRWVDIFFASFGLGLVVLSLVLMTIVYIIYYYNLKKVDPLGKVEMSGSNMFDIFIIACGTGLALGLWFVTIPVLIIAGIIIGIGYLGKSASDNKFEKQKEAIVNNDFNNAIENF